MKAPACAMVWHPTPISRIMALQHIECFHSELCGNWKLGRRQCHRRHKQASYGHILLSREPRSDFSLGAKIPHSGRCIRNELILPTPKVVAE